MAKTAAVVIVFNPDVLVAYNIQSYFFLVNQLYIADNSETTANTSLIETFASSTVYLHDGINKGIAARLNEVCKLAMSEGYQWLLTIDQDSFFEQNVLEKYLKNIDEFEHKAGVAMFGLENNDRLISKDKQTFKYVQTLITSGSVINLSLFDEVGGFNENLFIDLVDFEYCFKAIQKGFKIVKFTGLLLQHKIGEPLARRSLKNLKVTQRSFHSPFRLYYMLRNYLYLRKSYCFNFPTVFNSFKKDLLHRIKNSLVYGSNRFQTVRYLILAFTHYKKNRMGKL